MRFFPARQHPSAYALYEIFNLWDGIPRMQTYANAFSAGWYSRRYDASYHESTASRTLN